MKSSTLKVIKPLHQLSKATDVNQGSPVRALISDKHTNFEHCHLLSNEFQGINSIPKPDLFDPMDVRFLVTFLEVTKTRHFGKAAENLYLTQSAVSARIRQLEEYFNTTLFIRYRNSIQLTSAGEKLIPFAESLAGTLNDARKVLRESDVQHLTIGASPNASELHLHQILAAISQGITGLSVQAEILNNDQLSRQLHERTVDLAISTEAFKSDDLHSIKIADSCLTLYATDKHTSVDSVCDYVCIEWGTKVSDAIRNQLPELPKAKLQTSSIRVALDYILSNGGAAVLPETVASPLIAENRLFEIHPLADLSISCYLAYMKDVKQTSLLECIECVISSMKP